jgi:hypothetical protein
MTVLDVQDILDEMARIPGFEAGAVNSASLEAIRRAYNGCGPERWPQELRDRLDAETALFAPSILVHDMDFDRSDGKEDSLHDANERMHRNNRRIFRFYYPLFSLMMLKPSYRLKRARALGVMVALNVATSDGLTRKAWLESYDKRFASRED